VFEVVQDQQRLPGVEFGGDRFDQWLGRLLAYTDGAGYSSGHQVRVAHRRQPHEVDSIGEVVDHRFGGVDRQLGFADTAGSDQGYQSDGRLTQACANFGHVVAAAAWRAEDGRDEEHRIEHHHSAHVRIANPRLTDREFCRCGWEPAARPRTMALEEAVGLSGSLMHAFSSGSRALTLLVLMLVLNLAPPTPVLAAATLGDGWLAGPGATGANTYSGVVDTPSSGVQITTSGAVQVAGWFLDRTADGWAGADDVEIYLGTMANGGTLLTHAFFARQRPDVAATFGRPDWVASGWLALVPTTALVPGNNLVSVYAHSPAKGWWYKQVTVSLSAGATGRPVPPALGFDISYPQCDGPEPPAPAFAVVGVNGGRAYTGNPCLARQYVWALTATSPVQPRVAFYINTGNPGPDASTRWPRAGTTTPQPCDGSWSVACAYDYGWLAAQDAYARARSVAGDGAALVPWWLDVEAANSWADVTTNSADLQGAIDYLRSVPVAGVGIYALAGDWEDIVGAAAAGAPQNVPFSPLPNWRPGPGSAAADAGAWCSRSVTGGRVLFVQYQDANAFDANVLCP
jgi:hypothetical protein